MIMLRQQCLTPNYNYAIRRIATNNTICRGISKYNLDCSNVKKLQSQPQFFIRTLSTGRPSTISYRYNNNHHHENQQRIFQRHQHTVVYAIGEGWTGALGTGRIDQLILGHHDEDTTNSQQQSTNSTGADTNTDSNESSSKKSSWWSTFASKPSNSPVVLYDTSTERNNDTTTSKRLVSCAVGWGHTALIIEESITTNINASASNDNLLEAPERVDNQVIFTASDVAVAIPTQQTTFTNTQLLLTGRPHEFVSLLRLQRLPRTIRNWMTYHTYNTIRRANILERLSNEDQNNTISLNPIDMIGQTLTFLTKIFGNPKKDPDWDTARDQSYLIVPTSIPLPFDATTLATTSTGSTTPDDGMLPAIIDPTTPVLNDIPMDVACTAGVTAVTTARGYVYTFGLNGIGQCGIGDPCNNVWNPSRVTGLSREFSAAGYRATSLPQSYEIQQVCLGLQHGLCLNVAGEMFSWGKGDRGQLGNDNVENESHTAIPITKSVIMNDDYTSKIEYHALQTISQISSGMIHSAAYEMDTNSVYVWGKHTLPYLTDETIATGPRRKNLMMIRRMLARDKIASDARIPIRVNGLPRDQQVLRIACGSHHTSMLLEDGSVWCIGLTADTKRPLHHPVCIVEAGMIDLTTLTQFTAHMDRTTIVFDGQVLQVHLWDDPEYQKVAVFTPTWVDELLTNYPTARIREVHRSWLHTAIVADH